MELLSGIDLSTLAILKYPDPRLKAPAAEIGAIDDDIRRLAGRMLEILYAAHGVGLAATQVGIPLRVFVANPAGEPGPDEAVYINPRIVDQDGTILQDEGCLSFPGITTKIKRRKKVTLRAVNLEGESFEQTRQDLPARIFQHEMDHLDGVLLVDRMSIIARISNRWTLKDLEDGYAGR